MELNQLTSIKKEHIQDYTVRPISPSGPSNGNHLSDTWERNAPATAFREDENSGKMKDDGIKLIETYHKCIAPNIQPASVERKFLIKPENLKFTLMGYIDLIMDFKSFNDVCGLP